MGIITENRVSDSPFVETIWRTHSETNDQTITPADGRWDLVVMRQEGRINFSVWGPMSQAAPIPYTAGLECIGIRFKLGIFMPFLPTENFLNIGVNLPDASSKSFWLHGSAWQVPDFENAEMFVARLVHDGVLTDDPIVAAALQGHAKDVSTRTVRRRFLRATGFTPKAIQQIERARQAAALLEQGVSISDTTYEAGYADQPHLTRSLKRFFGQTPAQISHDEN